VLTLVAVWYSDDEVTGSNVTCGCCVPTPTQCATPTGSVNE